MKNANRFYLKQNMKQYPGQASGVRKFKQKVIAIWTKTCELLYKETEKRKELAKEQKNVQEETSDVNMNEKTLQVLFDELYSNIRELRKELAKYASTSKGPG